MTPFFLLFNSHYLATAVVYFLISRLLWSKGWTNINNYYLVHLLMMSSILIRIFDYFHSFASWMPLRVLVKAKMNIFAVHVKLILGHFHRRSRFRLYEKNMSKLTHVSPHCQLDSHDIKQSEPQRIMRDYWVPDSPRSWSYLLHREVFRFHRKRNVSVIKRAVLLLISNISQWRGKRNWKRQNKTRILV
jgi:hypothetical protein